MEVFDGPFYKYQKLFSRLLGLWPWQERKTRKVIYCILMLMCSSMTIPQIIILVEKFGVDLDIVFENFNLMMFNVNNIVKYTVSFANPRQLKEIFKQVADDWSTIKDKEEKRILLEQYEKSKLFVTIFSAYVMTSYAIVATVPFFPVFLDFAFPLENETRSLLLIHANFVFFDEYEHPYISMLIFVAAYTPQVILYLGVEGLYVLISGHACALFAIVGVDIKDEKAVNDLTIITDPSLKHKLAKAISLHNQTFSLYYKLDDLYSKLFLLVQFGIIIHIATISFYIPKTMATNKLRGVQGILFSIGVMMYVTNLNFIGQRLIDSSKDVFVSAYNSHWYLMTPRIRKFYILIMRRSLEPAQLTAGKIVIFSLYRLGLILKTSVSYYTILLSTI